MTKSNAAELATIKLFHVSNQMAENDLDRVERELSIDLGRKHVRLVESDQDYYPQISRDVRQEAASMSQHYEIFYSLEKTIRMLIAENLEDADPDWWESDRIPDEVRKGAKRRMADEVDTGITPRSLEPIDFTNFSELGKIINANRDIFGSMFPSEKALENVLGHLNILRRPIAHCSPLAEDEIVRLRLSVRDWFRLMS